MRDLTGASAEIVVVGGNRKRSTACSSNNSSSTNTNGANNSSSGSSSDSPEPKCPKRQRRSRRGSAATAAAAATTTTTTTTATTAAAAAGQAPEEQRPEARMEQGGDPITDDSTTTPGFVDCLRRIVLSDDPQVVNDAWNSLEEMENLESGSQDATYDCNRHYDRFLRDLLTNNHIRNVSEMPRLLEWFSKFPFPNTAHISDDIAKFLIASAKDFEHQPYLADILEVLSDNHTKYLTPHHNHSNLWKAIVEVLSWYKVPEDPGEVKKYSRDLNIISDFLKRKNTDTSGDKSNVFMCFMKLCEILIDSNRTKPSSALITILQLIDEKLWNEHMKVVVEQLFREYKRVHSNTDERVVKMLVLFCHWLAQPPFTHIKYLSTWLTLFMRGLMAVQKRRLVMDVADTVLPEIFSKCIRLQQFSQIENENNIIFYLMPHLSSLEIIHKMMKLIDSYLTDREVMMPKDANIRKHVIEITKELLRKFQQHFGNQPCSICDKVNSLIEYAEKNEGSRYVEVSFPSTSSGIGKIDSGKVGLRNLGNTCYMNSVLQALVMTRQFCHEVLLYKSTNDLSDQTVLKNLQNLFALLKYSEKNLAPTEILRTSRPAYFMPGQQQDSSEFLCHLLDVMYEQEKSALLKNSNSEQNINTKLKIEDKEMTDVEEVVGASDSPINDDGTPKTMARWTTEENLSEGEDLAQTQNGLSDSHSDSTDSGIQSVGGEDSSSSSSATSSSSFLVQRVFGGELKVTYQCMQCGTESHNTDQFRDLQLCFLDVDTMPPTHAIKVQDLINSNYSMPESLTGDNKYRCERCANLCDAQRIIKILQAPAHLILTLKHFRYDSESRLRTKLRRKVIYDETIQLPVLDQDNETYQLYAAVVHSGYSMDYGHYITYACDAKNRWYKFNDSYVSQTTLEDFKSLEPPDTPYILFYRRCGRHKEPDEDAPDFASLTKSLQDYVEQEKRGQSEERRVTRHSVAGSSITRYPKVYDRDDDDDEDHQPPSKCGDAVTIPNQKFLF